MGRKAIERTPNDLIAQVGLTSTYWMANRKEEARAAAREVLRINPNFSVERYASTYPMKDKVAKGQMIDALHKVGEIEIYLIPNGGGYQFVKTYLRDGSYILIEASGPKGGASRLGRRAFTEHALHERASLSPTRFLVNCVFPISPSTGQELQLKNYQQASRPSTRAGPE